MKPNKMKRGEKNTLFFLYLSKDILKKKRDASSRVRTRVFGADVSHKS